jgi:hypothetical protein
MSTQFPSRLSDDELIAEMNRLARCERHDIASLIAHIAEFDERKLHLALGYSSLFVYCCEVLKLSTGEAYRRIEVARYARKYPMILDKLANGSLNLTTVDLVAPQLSPTNCHEVLEEASGKSKREVQIQVAARAPRPFTPPAGHNRSDGASLPLSVASTSRPPKPRLVVIPLSADRSEVRFEVHNATLDKLKKAQDLMRHAIRDNDPGEILDRALTLLLKKVERKRCGKTDRPRACRPAKPGSDYIPADIKRAVWDRDGGRCAFIGKTGRRCNETSCVQEHHVIPRALGGPTTVENLQLRCAAHNRHDAAQAFGPEKLRSVGVVSERRACYRTAGATRAGVSSRMADAHIAMMPAEPSQVVSGRSTRASVSRSMRARPLVGDFPPTIVATSCLCNRRAGSTVSGSTSRMVMSALRPRREHAW